MIRAPTAPSASVHPISPHVGWAKCGSSSGWSEYALVLSAVQLEIPMNTNEPTPAAINPGTRMSGSVAPPRPLASMTSTAATIGEPKITEMAAKLPAAASTSSNCGGASRFASFTAKTASPPPMAISGASGPSTSPRPRVANAASATPGTSLGCVLPTCSPCAGMWPPLPGSFTIANATGMPASTRIGMGHQSGMVE